jgi:hypothetical protein
MMVRMKLKLTKQRQEPLSLVASFNFKSKKATIVDCVRLETALSTQLFSKLRLSKAAAVLSPSFQSMMLFPP